MHNQLSSHGCSMRTEIGNISTTTPLIQSTLQFASNPNTTTQRSQRKRKRANRRMRKKHYRQTRLPTLCDVSDIWGDSYIVKPDGHYRFITKNIDGLGVTLANSKADHLKDWLYDRDIDCCGLQELNINLSKVPYGVRIHSRLYDGRWESQKHSAAYNVHDNSARFQYGGTCAMAFNHITHYMKAFGSDPRKLGRWTWLQIQCQDKTSTRIISAYAPCIVRNPNATNTVYQQQRNYFLEQNISTCPLVMFHNDLLEELSKWVTDGDRIILMMDLNDSIESSTFVHDLRNLDIISATHRSHNGPYPPTFNRGRYQIDDIFVSMSISVSQCGMLPFGDGPGDHRGVFIDVPIIEVEGSNRDRIVRIPKRKLISSNPKVVKKFVNLFLQQLSRNHIIERVAELKRSFHIPLTQFEATQYEKIDRIILSAFRFAEKRCRKLRCGKVEFSPELSGIAREGRLWDMVLKRLKGCKVSMKLITRIAKKCDISHPLSLPQGEVNEKRDAAWKKYSEMKPHAREIRDRWLDQLADLIAASDGEEKARVIRMLKSREEIRQSHRNIKRAQKKKFSGGTAKLTRPDPNHPGETIEVEDKVEMEELLMKANEDKFRGAIGTPLTVEPLASELGLCGCTANSERILTGDFSHIHPSTSDAVLKFFTKVQLSEEVLKSPAISNEIRPIDFISTWKKQKEQTQSSLSGLHFGFFKTIIHTPILAETMAHMSSIPFQSGYAPERWKRSLNVHLLKKDGEYSPAKQRTIHLLEASFSAPTKTIFSQRLMRQTRRLKLIPDEQFAQKGKTCIDAAVLNVFMFDISRLSRRPTLCMSSDLESCYDRMVHSATGLSLRSLGIPPTIISCLSGCVMFMQHYIRTAFGDSDTCYGGDRNNPLQGGGQGNPAAPPMWIALTVILIKMMLDLDPGVSVIAPISLGILTLTLIMYVDDTNIFIQALTPNESAHSHIARAQKYLDHWCEYLAVTGGALRPSKCWWQITQFNWKNGRWKYNDELVQGESLSAMDSAGNIVEINQLRSSEAALILGVYMAADGNMKKQIQHMLSLSQTWADNVRSSFLNRYDSRLALISTISATWDYPLKATTLSRDECEKIMMPVYKNILSKIGANQKIPRVFRYASPGYHGLGLPHIYSRQGAAHLKLILDHAPFEGKLGGGFNHLLECCRIEIGTACSNIFQLKYSKWSFLLTDCWIKNTWEFTSVNNIVLEGPQTIPQRNAELDWSLMDSIMSEPTNLFSRAEVLGINRCRLFKKCFFISDICCSDGITLHPEATSHSPLSDRKPTIRYPYQECPSSVDWNAWEKAIQYCWTRSGEYSNKLRRNIGPWLPSCKSIWTLFYDCQLSSVYVELNGRWKCYKLVQQSRGYAVYHADTYLHQLPDHVIGVTILCKIGNSILHTSTPANIVTDDEHSASTYSVSSRNMILHQNYFINTQVLDRHMANILEYCVVPDNMLLKQSFIRADIVIVSDGSFHPTLKVATAAFKIENSMGTTLAYGYCRTPGHRSILDAYRAEAWGILLSLTFLKYVQDTLNVTNGVVTLWCDCISALRSSFENDLPASVQMQHYDILQEIYFIQRKLKISIKHKWVEGHQCERVADQPARMNREVDSLAKYHLTNCILNPRTQANIQPGQNHWYVEIEGIRIVKSFTKTITRMFHKRELFSYLCESDSQNRYIVQSTDWEAIRLASKSYTTNEKLWSSKLASGFVPVGKNMAKWGMWPNNICKRCGLVTEDILHLYTCPSVRAKEERTSAIKNLIEWMESVQTSPFIMMIFIDTLSAENGMKFSTQCPAVSHSSIVAAAYDQDQLGFRNFITGRISKKWSVAQQIYIDLAYPESRRTGKTWAAGLVRNLCSYSKVIWGKRSKEIHEDDSDRWRNEKHAELSDVVKQLFLLGPSSVSSEERFLYDTSLHTLTLLPITAKQQWINAVLAAQDFFENDLLQKFR